MVAVDYGSVCWRSVVDDGGLEQAFCVELASFVCHILGANGWDNQGYKFAERCDVSHLVSSSIRCCWKVGAVCTQNPVGNSRNKRPDLQNNQLVTANPHVVNMVVESRNLMMLLIAG